MKIGRFTGIGQSRRVQEKAQLSPVHEQKQIPKRKALLIGITYGTSAGAGGYAALKGPHADVAAMKKLLLDRYHYAESDIVVLLDSEDMAGSTVPAVQPTRMNILRAIDDLVRGARKGDRFFFHYCGHTMQVENRSNSEEDGMDECLVPVDGEANKIVDNELRRHLVSPLPVGSSLVAVFDSCHSASLLDLAHFRCNRVYVPWISKGRRRSDDRWNANVRRHALPLLPRSKPPTPIHSPPPSRSTSRPPLSRSNTHASARARSPPFTPLPPQSNALPKAPARRATRRATREMRELMQLLGNAPPMPMPAPVPEEMPTLVAEPVDELEPTRPNTPATPSEHHAALPLVTTRRIYEAARTAQGRLRAWRTEVDALEVGYQDLGVGEDGNGVATRARVEGGRSRITRGSMGEAGDDSKERMIRKRSSLPLVPLRLGSLGAGRLVEEEEEAAGTEAAKGKGKERRTAVTRARAVSVTVREGSGSGAGKENVMAGARPALSVAVPREQGRPVSWLEDERACESPAPVWPCTGWNCRDLTHGHDDRAEVISLASCKDYQLSWEDSSGGSMTRELVRILERDPHPTVRSLVTKVSHALHGMSLQRHMETRQYKRDLKKYNAFLERQRANAALHRPGSSGGPRGAATEDTVSHMSTLLPSTPDATAPVSRKSSFFPNPKEIEAADTSAVAVQKPRSALPVARSKSEGFVDEPTYDMDNFQDPQVSSHYPLNMEQTWCM
ncbi:Mitochondrial chaperone BCS1 [Mycena sanguinolenta]|uniref:Mitochondrial chaperone BCS1 n=1 Tax=Mycena sanguinolenta TaxID=230812 RepID=A0A8H6Y258_9AGAR|nr:Mitochondrial chaperone BCS1 [Mycena sanguinolenta]